MQQEAAEASAEVAAPQPVVEADVEDDFVIPDDPEEARQYMQSLLDQLSALKGMMHSLETERDAIQAAEAAAPVPTPVPAPEEEDGPVDPALLASLQQLRALEAENRRLEVLREQAQANAASAQRLRDSGATEEEIYAAELKEQASLQAQLQLMMTQLSVCSMLYV